VLVVDDDVAVASSFQLALQVEHDVHVEHDVSTASQWCSRHAVDVVVSDIYMHGATGLDLLARLRVDGIDAEVILVSAEPSVETAQQALRHGAFDYLVKPVSGRALRRTVAGAMERRRTREARRAPSVVPKGEPDSKSVRAHYQTLVEGLPLFVFELDAQTRTVLHADGRLIPTMRIPPAIGGRPAAWVRNDDREALEARIASVLRGDETDALVVQLDTTLGPRPARVFMRLLDSPPRLSGFCFEEVPTEPAPSTATTPPVEAPIEPPIDEPIDEEAERVFGRSPAMRRVLAEARLATQHNETVLLTGPTGTGKGVMAEWIHTQGPRGRAPFVALNCSSLRGELLDSELFGHAKGAFTSAVRERRGLVEEASGGTLFLDEIGEMSLETQARLLKVLEEHSFRRLGETQARTSDFRLICATNRDLVSEVEAGRFRQDLYFRVHVVTIRMPPLADRKGDIVPLARRLLSSLGHAETEISQAALDVLEAHAWPGNVRELRNALIRAVILARGAAISASHFAQLSRTSERVASVRAESVDDGAGDERIRALFARYDGNVAKIAREIDMPRTSLYRRLRRLGLA
jgi:DNA-binding NtrC family response regulator